MRDGAGQLLQERDLLAGSDLSFNGIQRWSLGQTRVVLGAGTGFAMSDMTHAVIVDAARGTVERSLATPPDTRYLAPLPDGRLALLHQGKLSVLDQATGATAVGPVDLAGPAGGASAPVEWLQGP